MIKNPELFRIMARASGSEIRTSEWEYMAAICDYSIPAKAPERADACSYLLDSGQLPEDNVVNVLYHRGGAWAEMEEYDRAIEDYTAVLEIDPDDHETLFDLAWLYVTSKTVQHRNGEEAMRLATRAVALRDVAHARQALAAACAETGRYKDAVREQKKAIEMGRREGYTAETIEVLEERMQLFDQGKPLMNPGNE